MIYTPAADHSKDKAMLAVAEFRCALQAMRDGNPIKALAHFTAGRDAALEAARDAAEAIEALNESRRQA